VILGLFTPKQSVIGISEIADSLQVSRSIAYDHVMTLLGVGYIEQAAAFYLTSAPRNAGEP
jgi:DNA-binding IclR family transcriptional regulator